MLKMTNDLFTKMSSKQEDLDAMIREKFNISPDQWLTDYHPNHLIALRGEIAEFINEAHDLWKYWKTKSINHDDLADEAVDVIHFLHLLLNKHQTEQETLVMHLNRRIEIYRAILKVGQAPDGTNSVVQYAKYLNKMYELDDSIESYLEIYAILLCVLDHYAFTIADVESAYDKKNEENHARQQRNY